MSTMADVSGNSSQHVDWRGIEAAGTPDGPNRHDEVRTVVTPLLLILAGVCFILAGHAIVGAILLVLGLLVGIFQFAVGAVFAHFVLRRGSNIFAALAKFAQPGVKHRSAQDEADPDDDPHEVQIDRTVGFALTRKSAEGGFFCMGMSEEDIATRKQHVLEERLALYDWLMAGPEFVEVSTEADDGVRLWAHAWVNPQASGRWVVLCHGYAGTWGSMLQYARPWAQAGYNLLIVSMRGHERSGGRFIGMGYLDGSDVVCWAKYLLAPDAGLPAATDIMLMGQSMGAHAVLNASGRDDLPAQVRAIFSDCGFDAMWNTLEHIAKSFELPCHPTLELIRRYMRHVPGGFDIACDDAAAQVAKSRTPILFLQGTADTTVGAGCVRRLYEAAACEKDVLLVDGAGHCMASLLVPDVYWVRVLGFALAHLG